MLRRLLLPLSLIVGFGIASTAQQSSNRIGIMTLAYRMWDESITTICVDNALLGSSFDMEGYASTPKVVAAALEHYGVIAQLEEIDGSPFGKLWLNRNTNWRFDSVPHLSDLTISTTVLQLDDRLLANARSCLLADHVYYNVKDHPQRVTFLAESRVLIVTARRGTSLRVVSALLATACGARGRARHESSQVGTWWYFPYSY